MALDANSRRRLEGRSVALAALPDYPSRRQRAHQVRGDVVANLDQYLEQFINQVEANGMIVHRAADANQAVQIILAIAREHNASLIAKSKSMLSEEVALNHALEAAGIQVIETDLGEYICQLRGEAPSHIITPAVHLRCEEVGVTFHEKLAIPYTTDIPVLTQTARQVLRQIFFDADIGLSGVNFGVVETGTLCLVTNEGNGRMVTTLPPVHIALMGIERMLPTMDDLDLMLSLLPRYATGQKLSVYTSLIHSPRHPQETDGPVERHLVLVDNGRSAMQKSPLAEALLCIRCGACLNACPVFREIGGHAYVGMDGQGSTYPGPIGSVLSPGFFGQLEFGHLARASSLCGACKDACPVDIDLPKMLLRVRAGMVSEGVGDPQTKPPQPNPPPLLKLILRIFTWFAISPRRFTLAQRLAGFLSRFASPFIGSKNVAGKVYLRLPAFTGWGYSKDFPRPSSRSFHQRWKAQNNKPVAMPSSGNSPASQFQDSDLAGDTQPSEAAPSLVDRFSEELSVLGGQVIQCKLDELPDRVMRLLFARGENTLLAWEPNQLPQILVERLQAEHIEMVSPGRIFDGTLSAIPGIGLTGALGGIAETGSLIQVSGISRPLTASLLPEVHVAILWVSDILPTVNAALQIPELRQSTSAVLITGPSRTADIEMTLTIGVHGPAEVIVFCIE
jgi:L-lactate dehydrogenase complex protein LldF